MSQHQKMAKIVFGLNYGEEKEVREGNILTFIYLLCYIYGSCCNWCPMCVQCNAHILGRVVPN